MAKLNLRSSDGREPTPAREDQPVVHVPRLLARDLYPRSRAIERLSPWSGLVVGYFDVFMNEDADLSRKLCVCIICILWCCV